MATGFYKHSSVAPSELNWITENSKVVGRMSTDVVNAIKNSVNLIETDRFPSPLNNYSLWEYSNNEAVFFKYLFSNMEVLPEIYYLNKQTKKSTYVMYPNPITMYPSNVGLWDGANPTARYNESDVVMISSPRTTAFQSYTANGMLSEKLFNRKEQESGLIPALSSNTSSNLGEAFIDLINGTFYTSKGQSEASAFKAFDGVIQTGAWSSSLPENYLLFGLTNNTIEANIGFNFNENQTIFNCKVSVLGTGSGGVYIPEALTLIYSDDGNSWTNVGTVNTTSGQYTYTFDIDAGSHKYWAVKITNTGKEWTGISEISFNSETVIAHADYFKTLNNDDPDIVSWLNINHNTLSGSVTQNDTYISKIEALKYHDLLNVASKEEVAKYGTFTAFTDVLGNSVTRLAAYNDNLAISSGNYHASGLGQKWRLEFSQSYGEKENVSSSNKRARQGKQYTEDGTTLADSQFEGNNDFFFVVKTFLPYLNDDGSVDESMTAEQIWFFSVHSLLENQSLKRGGQKWARYNDFEGLAFVNSNNSAPLMINLPIPYEIQKLKYFNGSTTSDGKVYDSTLVLKPVNRQNFTTGDSVYVDIDNAKIPAQYGCTILADYAEQIVQFFVDGLGLKATSILNEATQTAVDEWEALPEIYGPPSDAEPGSGGQTSEGEAGGDGTGAGEWSNDDVGTGQESTFTEGVGTTYIMNWNNVEKLKTHLTDPTLWESLQRLVMSNTEATIKMTKLPMNLTNLLSNINEEVVEVNGVLLGSTTASEESVVAKVLPNGIKTKWLLGQMDVALKYKSFVDFNYTSFNLYVPFYGFISLNAEDIMGRRMKVYLNVSYSKGTGLIILYTSNNITYNNDFSNIESGGMHPLMTIPINFGENLSLSSNGNLTGEIARITGAFSAGLGLAGASFKTSNVPVYDNKKKPVKDEYGRNKTQEITEYVGVGISDVANSIMNLGGATAIGGGNADDLHSFSVCDTVPFMIVGFPQVEKPSGYSKEYGNPVCIIDKLIKYKGYTKCEHVKIHSSRATSNEISELQQILESEVVIL